MTLQEAINSGRRFGRRSDAVGGEYFTAVEFEGQGISIEDVSATDYELEPEVTVKASYLVKAWNASRMRTDGTPRNGISAAGSSDFFKSFLTHLGNAGIKVNRDVTL